MKVSRQPRERAILGQVSDLDLRLLRVFKAVAECGGMAAAELELNIGTSTVSRHVKDLETRLGLRLCRRGRGGFGLTAEGDRVYREILKLLGSVEAFRGGIDDIHRRMGGQLEIALFDKTVSNPEARIHVAVERFTTLAPEVRLSVHVDSINGIERGLLDGTYHVGVIPTHRSSKALSYTDLFGETVLMYCGVRHPLFSTDNDGLSWAKLRKLPFAGLGYHSPNMVASHKARLERAATGFDQEAIATLVLSGAYLGFLPDHYADSFVKAGQLRAVHPQRFRYVCRFASVVRRSPAPSRVVRAFAECLATAHQKPSA
ncbi:LysR family transcriptional regulator [Peristeroidobacter soli]|uniref:LysR family transcriptional regulator n=1 Tax=Peristeroidobacter soli TaxID=2497877 RepID=UPI00101BB74A|nr:LysR family transcriptional regulator [Peristeroidobacter soli]